MQNLKEDPWGYSTAAMAGTIIGIVVTVVIAVALIATVANQAFLAANNASFKNTNASRGATFQSAQGILPLLVLFFVIGVVILPIALIFAALRHEDG